MNFFKKLCEVFYPEHFACLLCDKEVFNGENFCPECERKIVLNDGITCPICGRRNSVDQICMECKDYAPLYDKGISAFVYKDGARALILKFKNNCSYLKNYLSVKMYESCRDLTDVDGVCFVPMTAKAIRNRGYNQSELLATDLAKMLSLPLLKNAIAKIKSSKPQKSLTRKERIENLRGCFRATAEVKGKNLIVVDDVLTTGATAEAVCKELKRHGAKKLYFVTAASVEYQEELV